MSKPIHREKPRLHDLEQAKQLRQRTQRLSPQRQQRILQHVADHPEQEHTIESLSWLNAKSQEESLRNFCNVHALIKAGQLRHESRQNPALTLP